MSKSKRSMDSSRRSFLKSTGLAAVAAITHSTTGLEAQVPTVAQHASANEVRLATPVTLVSILKGVSYGWRQERLAKNADELRRIAGEFHERVRGFAEYYADAGRHLSRAMEAYNRSVGSWDARLLPSLKRMRELGVGATAEPPQPVRIDTAARQPQLPDESIRPT